MAERPYWSGQIRISLVTFDITLKSALRRGAQIPLHEFDRKTGERIHHRNVTEAGREVKAEAIVKGYDVGDDQVIMLEKDEIAELKLPSSEILELSTFVPLSAISPARFERPYFVLPGSKGAKEIYGVIFRALTENAVAGVGQIAMRGREELCAVIASEKGLMLLTLRYDAELGDDDIFPPVTVKLKPDHVSLANQLIKKNTRAPNFSRFHDRYHETLLALIKAKKANQKVKPVKAQKAPAKIVNFADALRASLKGGKFKPRQKAA